jgi:hypothetical protein
LADKKRFCPDADTGDAVVRTAQQGIAHWMWARSSSACVVQHPGA